MDSNKLKEWIEIGKRYHHSHIIIVFCRISKTYQPVYHHPDDQDSLEFKQDKYNNHDRFNLIETISLE